MSQSQSQTQSTDPLWVYPVSNPELQGQIVKEFRIHPITAQILVSRGFDTFDRINHYLYSKLPDLDDPHLFLDMDKAVERILAAVNKKEGVLIYGDNDVDGMTGTALLAEFLKSIGANVFFYVPHHTIQRQNLFIDALNYAVHNQCSLMITVDCGITAAKELDEIVRHSIDVIITDHHEPTDKIPHCIATLNPKLVNQTYPNRDLTGVGVAFKLVHAILNTLISLDLLPAKKIDLKSYLDLVALGTIADMGSLLGENRILVRYGLKQLQKTKRVGLLKLFTISGVERSELTTVDIASKVAPRMNSLGRVADPRKGVELLLVRNADTAEALAKELDLFNMERQKVEQIMSLDVEKMISDSPFLLHQRAIVLHSNQWHPGIIPILSARIAKQYNRPTIIIAVDNGTGKGSIRTIREFPLLPVLKQCSDLLTNFGGHDFAAGLTLPEENLPLFKSRFLEIANEKLKDNDILSKLYIDGQANFTDLTYDLLSSLELFEPYGNENLQPILYCEAKQAWPPKVIGSSHLKLYLEQDDRLLEGIAFGMADRRLLLKKRDLKLRIAYTPQINRFHNKSSIQLLIRDFQIVK